MQPCQQDSSAYLPFSQTCQRYQVQSRRQVSQFIELFASWVILHAFLLLMGKFLLCMLIDPDKEILFA